MIELFNRADFLSRVTHRQRETSAIADTKGGAALSTRFPDKDSVIPELSVQPLDTNIYHPDTGARHSVTKRVKC